MAELLESEAERKRVFRLCFAALGCHIIKKAPAFPISPSISRAKGPKEAEASKKTEKICCIFWKSVL
ncbi:MAG: hypothetical protein K5990_04475 [Oscillospiraceae bacterium]|nr:hypothetical protein [Oscillospiraceae bacterium]